MSVSVTKLHSILCWTLLSYSLVDKTTNREPLSCTRITLSCQDFTSFKATFSLSFRVFLSFGILVGSNKSFSIAWRKSSKVLHFVSFNQNNLDVVNFFLSGFRITLTLSIVSGSHKLSWLERNESLCGAVGWQIYQILF